MASSVVQITDRESNERIINEAERDIVPTVFYISNSSLAACRAFTVKYEALSKQWPGVRFTQIEYAQDTSSLFKFSPNQLPVLTLMTREKAGSMWCKTIMGADPEALRAALEEMLMRAGTSER